MSTGPSVGVEEEFLVVDAETRAPVAMTDHLLADVDADVPGDVDRELQRSQIEIGTPVCWSLAEVRTHLTDLRAALAEAAARRGARLLASATHPFARWDDPGTSITAKPAYLGIQRDYAHLAREHLIGGCHVHVGIADREEVIRVMNGSRAWVPILVALSANSPFWAATDTGYASYRREVFARWPTAGGPEHFGSWAAYEEVVDTLLRTGGIDAPARLYWDIRPSVRYETVEFRAADVCATVDEAVMVAGLVRALAVTFRTVDSPPTPRPEVLRAAVWRAARHGLDGTLVDVAGRAPVPRLTVWPTMADTSSQSPTSSSAGRTAVNRAATTSAAGRAASSAAGSVGPPAPVRGRGRCHDR